MLGTVVRAWVPLKRFLRVRWFSIDHRTLGLFRIGFGLCLLGNLYDHAAGGNLVTFFSNDGVLSNHLALFAPIQPRPWSLLFAFSGPGEVAVAFAAIAAVYLLYTLGWKTRLMQILVIVCFVSIVNRNLLLQDGGSFTCTVLAVWTAFLPLGARFSLDAWQRRCFASAHRTANLAAAPFGSPVSPVSPVSHVSIVCFVLLAQLAAIYGFNAANKTGQTWHTGTAVHYILWQLSRNTTLAGFLRLHEPAWFSPLLTRGTLVFEWTAPLLALSPIFQTVCRRLLIAGMWTLHLGIAALMSLGPFSYVMLAFSLLLLRPADWDLLNRSSLVRRANAGAFPFFRRLVTPLPIIARRLGVATEGREVGREGVQVRVWSLPVYGDRLLGARTHWRPVLVSLREAFALILLAAMLAELTLANVVVPERFRCNNRPAWMAEVLYYLRVYQTWGMFSPDVPTTDGGIVIAALLADGTRIDPLTGRAPDFDAPLHGPYRLDHDWSEYMFYYPWERHRSFRAGLRDYVVRRHQAQEPAPEKRLQSFEVYFVTADCPPPGELQPRNLKRELMISYVADP
ncbi:MAG: HTTM domain-containing protein [Myxococcales bacterium]